MPLSLNEIRVRARAGESPGRAAQGRGRRLSGRRKNRRPQPSKFTTGAGRVAFMFERDQALASLLPAEKPKKTPKKKEGAA